MPALEPNPIRARTNTTDAADWPDAAGTGADRGERVAARPVREDHEREQDRDESEMGHRRVPVRGASRTAGLWRCSASDQQHDESAISSHSTGRSTTLAAAGTISRLQTNSGNVRLHGPARQAVSRSSRCRRATPGSRRSRPATTNHGPRARRDRGVTPANGNRSGIDATNVALPVSTASAATSARGGRRPPSSTPTASDPGMRRGATPAPRSTASAAAAIAAGQTRAGGRHRPTIRRSAARIAIGSGGQPGTSRSTGTTSATAPSTP